MYHKEMVEKDADQKLSNWKVIKEGGKDNTGWLRAERRPRLVLALERPEIVAFNLSLSASTKKRRFFNSTKETILK